MSWEVRDEQPVRGEERLPFRRAQREEHAVRGRGEREEAGGDVPHVDDAVVGEESGMVDRVGEEAGVVGERLEPRSLLDRAPVALLQELAQLGGQQLVDRAHCGDGRGASTVRDSCG
jgi:hypothetical protein